MFVIYYKIYSYCTKRQYIFPLNKNEIEIYKIKLRKIIDYACSNLITC